MTARIALFDLGHVVLDWDPARLYRKIFDDPHHTAVSRGAAVGGDCHEVKLNGQIDRSR